MTVRASKFPSVQLDNRQDDRIKREKENYKKLIQTKKEELRENLDRCKPEKTQFHINRYIEYLIYILNINQDG